MCPNKLAEPKTYQIGKLTITDVDGDGRLSLVDQIEGSVGEDGLGFFGVKAKYFHYDPQRPDPARKKPLGDQYDETLAGVNEELAKKYNGFQLEDWGDLAPAVFKTKIMDAEDVSAGLYAPYQLRKSISDARVFALQNGILFDEQWAVDTWEAGLQKFFNHQVHRTEDLRDVYKSLEEIRALGGPSLSLEGERRLVEELVDERFRDLKWESAHVPPSSVNAELEELKALSEKLGLLWNSEYADAIRESQPRRYFNHLVDSLAKVLNGVGAFVLPIDGYRRPYWGNIHFKEPWEMTRIWEELQTLETIRANLQFLREEGGSTLAPKMEVRLLQGILERKVKVAKEYPEAVSPQDLRLARITVEAFADKHGIGMNVQEAVEIERQVRDYWDRGAVLQRFFDHRRAQ